MKSNQTPFAPTPVTALSHLPLADPCRSKTNKKNWAIWSIFWRNAPGERFLCIDLEMEHDAVVSFKEKVKLKECHEQIGELAGAEEAFPWGKMTFPKDRLVLILPSLKERMIHTGSIGKKNGENSILHLLLILIAFSWIFKWQAEFLTPNTATLLIQKNASLHARQFLTLEAASFTCWYLINLGQIKASLVGYCTRDLLICDA